ncbi:hypothetical protein THERMOT_1328 [Bathymodiolus thermophilus thioautotrophic gill symbiont]|uniref:hypothetical protein n=1 Tax=Bathymodiolus thermophilus thioautotrophic gill symbiont TaxID=2360 RepID=UPI00192C7C42|nr:hypothetical protein [Bathymodiolus thermophilus thioautotrophic gill symbiont]CAB5500929.1 hypothetical protein THERMOT_1328 [Bathymodiolus thermophilus thioautotrophic gill symbiont]
MNNHQESTFHPLGNFLNPALALLGQGLRKSPSGQKLNFANHSYLCKGLIIYFFLKLIFLYTDNELIAPVEIKPCKSVTFASFYQSKILNIVQANKHQFT